MRNVIGLSSSMFLSFGALFSWTLIFPVHLKKLGATEPEIAIAYMLFAVALTAFQLLGGMLADRFGRKITIVIPAFVMTPLIILLVFADHWIWATALFILINIAGAMQFPAFSALLAESTPNRHRAFIWFEAALSFGAMVGPIVSGLMLLALDIQAVFWMSSIVSLVAAIVALLFLTETRHTETAHQKLRLSDVFRPNLRWYFLAHIFIALAFSVSILGPFPTLHLEESLHQTESDINFLFAAGWGIAAILSLVGENLASKLGSKKILLWSTLFHPLALLVWVFIGTSDWHILPFVLSFFFAQFILVGNHMMAAELTTPSNRGRILGLLGTIPGLIRSIGPVLAMHAKLSWGDWLPFGLAALWGLIAFLALIPCKPEPEKASKN